MFGSWIETPSRDEGLYGEMDYPRIKREYQCIRQTQLYPTRLWQVKRHGELYCSAVAAESSMFYSWICSDFAFGLHTSERMASELGILFHAPTIQHPRSSHRAVDGVSADAAQQGKNRNRIVKTSSRITCMWSIVQSKSAIERLSNRSNRPTLRLRYVTRDQNLTAS